MPFGNSAPSPTRSPDTLARALPLTPFLHENGPENVCFPGRNFSKIPRLDQIVARRLKRHEQPVPVRRQVGFRGTLRGLADLPRQHLNGCLVQPRLPQPIPPATCTALPAQPPAQPTTSRPPTGSKLPPRRL